MEPAGIGVEVEGVHATRAALDAGRVERLLVDAGRHDSLHELIAAADRQGVAVDIVPDVRDRARTSAPQGVIALCRAITPAELDDAVGRASPAAIVVLDHVEDDRNAGAIARSAVAAGCTAIVLSTRRSAPLGAAAFKAAAGALEHLDIVQVSSIAEAVEALRRLGVWSVGLDTGGSEQLFGLGLLSEPVAIVVGAEGRGLSRLVAERVDVVASIPVDERVESLNASVAAAIALFEVQRVRAG